MVYSGNLNAFRAVVDSIRALGFDVTFEECNDRVRRHYWMRLIIRDSTREIITEETFTACDEDILINSATAWLHRMGEQLAYWK